LKGKEERYRERKRGNEGKVEKARERWKRKDGREKR
jgi:hypothetical protein